MRILSVAATPPFPPDHATRIRSWALLRRTASWADVTLLTWGDGELPAELSGVLEQAILGPLGGAPMGAPVRARRWGRALCGGPPPWIQAVREERSGTPWDEVSGLHARRPFDLVVAEEDAATSLVPDLGVPVVFHRHNVFSRTLRELAGPLRALAWPLEGGVWRRFDRTAGAADVVVVPTETTAGRLRDVAPEARVAVVPNGVDAPSSAIDPSQGAGVVFVGTMDYAPNAEAVRWFRRRIWDGIRGGAPEARFLVVGAGADDRFTSGDGVEVLGYVPDLVGTCARARVGVVPLRSGVGIKTKTLELLGMGLPVVSTSVGGEGIPSTDGVIVADDPVAFRDAVLRLLADPEEAVRRGRAGRELVVERFGWEEAAGTYRDLLLETASAGRRSGVRP